MSEYAVRNLMCASWHRTPEGWRSWSGMVRGWTARPFCDGAAGHVGDHHTWIEADGETAFGASRTMFWPNTLGIPKWLIDTTIHGLNMLIDRYPQAANRPLSEVMEQLEAEKHA